MPICQGINRNGSKCQNRVREGEKFCFRHRYQAQPEGNDFQAPEKTMEPPRRNLTQIAGNITHAAGRILRALKEIRRALGPRTVRLQIGLTLLAAFFGAVLGTVVGLRVAGRPATRPAMTEQQPQVHNVAAQRAPGVVLTATPLLPRVIKHLGDEIRTDQWAITILEVRRAETLSWNRQELSPSGQWLIVYGKVQNLTTRPIALFASDFELELPPLKGRVVVNRDATGAAGLASGIDRTVAGFMGLTIDAGQTQPLVVAFDIPEVAEQAILWLAGTEFSVDLGSVKDAALLPTPSPTVTLTPTSTRTPHPSATPKPTRTRTPTVRSTSTIEGMPTLTPSPTRVTSTPTPIGTPTATGTPTTAVREIRATVIAARGLVVRAGPGSDFLRVGGLARGMEVLLSARDGSGTWVRGRVPGMNLEGWFSARYLEAEDDIMTLPVITTGS